MPNDFDALISEMEEAGLDESYIERLRSATAASPIRKERDAYKAQAEAALAQAKQYQSAVAAARFKDLGIKVNPSVLQTPDDLDWADEAKVREWAAGAGLIDAPDPNVVPPEVAGHDRVNQATQGAPPPPNPGSKEALLARMDPNKLTEEQFWAEARAAGLTNNV